MRKSLRKTFNRVDRGKCDIKYIGEKLQAELDLDNVVITSEWKDNSKLIRMLYTEREDEDTLWWLLPGNWAVELSPELNNEACLLYDLLAEHYR